MRKIIKQLIVKSRSKGSNYVHKNIEHDDPFIKQYALIRRSNIIIFDVGANVGQTAIKYLAQFPAAQIFCFEPYPSSIKQLKSTFSGNDNIKIVETAIADTIGNKPFYVNDNTATNSLYPRPASLRRYYDKNAQYKETTAVKVDTLDNIAKMMNLSHIDILKLDIQGGELSALKGAESLIRKEAISLIYTEIKFIPHYEDAPLFNKIWDYLERYGYTIFGIYNIVKANNGQIRFADAIFISKSIRAKVVDKYPEEP
ncbi:MAG: FkbM family methyltransferase [Nitrospirota bacterium]|nr:MAG: FkbM family methyltransferase [Nitrospirota bacterium]